jgi:hypothetical protein
MLVRTGGLGTYILDAASLKPQKPARPLVSFLIVSRRTGKVLVVGIVAATDVVDEANLHIVDAHAHGHARKRWTCFIRSHQGVCLDIGSFVSFFLAQQVSRREKR